tara:strand:- start:4225 stop:4386 length:162 start_codon:yes stop_codon:yes gene_type:complete
MVGQFVEFQIDHGIYESGIVRKHCANSGSIIVEDLDGEIWKGFEHQVEVVGDV